jgi:hypothetical protein
VLPQHLHTKNEKIRRASVQFGNGSTFVVPKSGVEAGVWNDALRPRVAVPRLPRFCGGNTLADRSQAVRSFIQHMTSGVEGGVERLLNMRLAKRPSSMRKYAYLSKKTIEVKLHGHHLFAVHVHLLVFYQILCFLFIEFALCIFFFFFFLFFFLI